jgi:hypothetical protein
MPTASASAAAEHSKGWVDDTARVTALYSFHVRCAAADRIQAISELVAPARLPPGLPTLHPPRHAGAMILQ